MQRWNCREINRCDKCDRCDRCDKCDKCDKCANVKMSFYRVGRYLHLDKNLKPILCFAVYSSFFKSLS